MSEIGELIKRALRESATARSSGRGSKEFLEWYAAGSRMSQDVAVHAIRLPKAGSLVVTIGRPSFGFSKESQVEASWTRSFGEETCPATAAKEVEDAILWVIASSIMSS